MSYKSNSRDASPSSKTGLKNSSDLYKIKKQTAPITTTKIPVNRLNLTSTSKFVKEDRSISPTAAKLDNSASKNKSPTNSTSLRKRIDDPCNPIVKPQSQNFNSRKDIDKFANKKSVSKDKSLSFNSLTDQNNIRPATSTTVVTAKKGPISLLAKFEMMKNNRKPSNSPNRVTSNQPAQSSSKKQDTFFHTRNKSKDSLKDENLTPKTNPGSNNTGTGTSNNNSNNSSKVETKTKINDITSKSKSKDKDSKQIKPNYSPTSRINRFEKGSTIQGKIDFRDLNTSPLLLHKNKNQKKKEATSTSGSKDFASKTPIKAISISKKQTNSLIQKLLTKDKAESEIEVQKPDQLKKFEHKNTVIIDSKSLADQLHQLKPINPQEKSSSKNNPEVTPGSNTDLYKKDRDPKIFAQKFINKVYEISRIGYSPGVKKTNQDNYFIFENFLGNQDSIYMAVCDGHGVNGHDVSKYLRENLPNQVNKEWLEKLKNKKGASLTIDEHHKVLENSFSKINNQIINDLPSDTTFSGSTCVSLIYNTDHLICANVGDSRCTVGRRLGDSDWKHHDLSRDHKPNDKDEMARIKSSGGRIEPYYDENGDQAGPYRVWLTNYDYPGLAMSRSFGDEVAASVGVIAVPEIVEWKLTDADKFIILASDGLWEFMESDEVVSIVKDYYVKNDIQGAAEFLVKESSKRWIKVSFY